MSGDDEDDIVPVSMALLSPEEDSCLDCGEGGRIESVSEQKTQQTGPCRWDKDTEKEK